MRPANGPRTFVQTCKKVRKEYPKLWKHHGKVNRRHMVTYWLPGNQLSLFSTINGMYGVLKAAVS